MNQPLILTTPEQILILRRRLDWTQGRLALEARVDPKTVQEIEREMVRPRPHTLDKIFGVLRKESAKMTLCTTCKLDPADPVTVSCSGYHKIRMHEGQMLSPVQWAADPADRCPHCNILGGGFHHPECPLERCPKCDGMLINCTC